MASETPLHAWHVANRAKMVDFGGWDMPLHYGSQLNEHHQVRNHSGLFDVSHMTVVDVSGKDARNYLQFLLANDIAKLSEPGKALYSIMLNETGGVVDDLIAYFVALNRYRLVVNCATREKDLAWMQKHIASYDIQIKERPDLGILAIQGPKASALFGEAYPEIQIRDLDGFCFLEAGSWMVAATGYTGEEGVEVILPSVEIEKVWRRLVDLGVKPAGLGARDTLRLEAGYCLYGHEMDDEISPWSANLGWTLALSDQRDFVGRAALEAAKQSGDPTKLVGLVLEDRGVIRAGQTVTDLSGAEGIVTSGSYSPTMEKSIALARVPMSVSGHCDVWVRDKKLRAKVVKPAFVRQGKVLV